MIRFLFRLLGFLILAAGFVALVIDGTRSIASGSIDLTSTGTSWAAASPKSLQSARDLLGAGGEGALNLLLAQPTAAVLVVIGILFMLIGRRRRRPVGMVP